MTGDARQRRNLNDAQWKVLERLNRARNGDWTSETVTEVASAVGLTPGQALVAMKQLERKGLAIVAGAAPNGGRTWKSVPPIEREGRA